jgi:hypothetical protein
MQAICHQNVFQALMILNHNLQTHTLSLTCKTHAHTHSQILTHTLQRKTHTGKSQTRRLQTLSLCFTHTLTHIHTP